MAVRVCRVVGSGRGSWGLGIGQFGVQAIRSIGTNLDSQYMRQSTVEKRLTNLEARVSELDSMVNQPSREKDWRRSIGVFTDDPLMQAVLDDSLHIRAADRSRAHRRTNKKASRA